MFTAVTHVVQILVIDLSVVSKSESADRLLDHYYH